MSFGEWMRERRMQQGRTQANCAESAGMKIQQWNRLEKHVGQPEKETVLLVACALRASEDEALSAGGYASSEQTPDLRLARKLDNILRAIPDNKRRKIEQWLENDAERYVSLLTA